MQPTDECCHCNVFIAVLYLRHLALKTTDMVFKALSGLHINGEEVINVVLEFAPGSELTVEGLPHLLEVSNRVARKRVELVEGNPLEAGGENQPHEEVKLRIDRHHILVVPKMLNGIGRSGVEVAALHHELPRKMMGHDFCQKRGAGNPQAPHLHLITGLSDRSFDVF